MTAFNEPLTFPVNVQGKELTATLEQVLDDHSLYFGGRIAFSDGFTDDFHLVDDCEFPQGDSEGWEPYGQALSYDLPVAAYLEAGKFYHVFQETIDGEKLNIWVVNKENTDKDSYAVYYKGYYHFELYKPSDKEDWQVQSISKSEQKIDTSLAERVRYLLNSIF